MAATGNHPESTKQHVRASYRTALAILVLGAVSTLTVFAAAWREHRATVQAELRSEVAIGTRSFQFAIADYVDLVVSLQAYAEGSGGAPDHRQLRAILSRLARGQPAVQGLGPVPASSVTAFVAASIANVLSRRALQVAALSRLPHRIAFRSACRHGGRADHWSHGVHPLGGPPFRGVRGPQATAGSRNRVAPPHIPRRRAHAPSGRSRCGRLCSPALAHRRPATAVAGR